MPASQRATPKGSPHWGWCRSATALVVRDSQEFSAAQRSEVYLLLSTTPVPSGGRGPPAPWVYLGTPWRCHLGPTLPTACPPLQRPGEGGIWVQNRGLRTNAALCPAGTRAQVVTRVQIKADGQEAELGTHTLTLTAALFQAWTGLGEWPTLGPCFHNHGPEWSMEVGEG